MTRRRSNRLALGAGLAATLLATNLSAGAGVAQAETPTCASGFTALTVADETVCELRFTETGSTTWTPPGDLASVDVLVVGGGGGGGFGAYGNGTDIAFGGGGGGGGQVAIQTGVALSGDVSVTVGAGGTGGRNSGTSAPPTDGSSSSFGTITAAGGGAAAPFPSTTDPGAAGGSSGTNTGGSGFYYDTGLATAGGGGAGAGASGRSARLGTATAQPGSGGIGVQPTTGEFAGMTRTFEDCDPEDGCETRTVLASFGDGGGGGAGETLAGGNPATAFGGVWNGTVEDFSRGSSPAGRGDNGFATASSNLDAVPNFGGGGGGGGTTRAASVGDGGNGGAGVVILRYQLGELPAAPVWTTGATLPNATAGSAYSQVLTATGSPTPTYAFAEGELPAGLVFDADTNTVSGTTTTAGTFTFTVTASNSEGSVDRTFSLTIDRSTNVSTDRTVVREGESATLTISGVPTRLCAVWLNGVLLDVDFLGDSEGGTIPWSGLMSPEDTVDKVLVIRCYAVDFVAGANPSLDDPFESGVTITFEASVSYSAQGYFAPVDRGVHNTIKGGNSVPLKFRVFDGETEITDPAILTFRMTQIPCTNEPVDAIEQVVSGATALKYDPVARQFIQTWRTPKQPGKCYTVSHWIGETQLVSAQFKLR